MIAVFLLSVLGGLTFIEQEIPGFSPNTTNFHWADIDGDGATDLILRDKVFFQRNGLYDVDHPAPLPAHDEVFEYDVWHGDLYLRLEGRLEVVRWEAHRWRRQMACAVTWPRTATAHSWREYLQQAHPGALESDDALEQEASSACAGHFLHDFDADGTPEIVQPSESGLHIFQRNEETYAEVACLDIFPVPDVDYIDAQALWPPEKRHIAFPIRYAECDFALEGNSITVVARETPSDDVVPYYTTRYTLDTKNEFAVIVDKTEITVSEPLPAYFRPCRLNKDAQIDFIGFDWERSKSSVVGPPVMKTCATVDGGKTIQTRVTRSFGSSGFRQSWGGLRDFVDFDGDGDLDMVTQPTGLFDGGLREMVARALTQRKVKHDVHVYLQDARGRFSDEPDVQARFTLHFEEPLIRWDDTASDYAHGWRVNMMGDFNGDGYRDIVVQERANVLAVYLCKGQKYSRKPDAVIELGACKRAQFGVNDCNGDGLSDILVDLQETEQDMLRYVTFCAREDGK
ncbi:MAG TPA: VCBS repeat-containing protein [Candidatus Hydrogenedentes bacterium]|nr:VCBS repeat-containing protein [Candidatus Hydrogenedentota bacterium]